MSDPIPQLQMIRNDNADEVAPNLGVFIGRWAVVPFIGAICFISIMNTLTFMGLDFLTSIIAASAPAALMTVFVIVVINKRPPNYVRELTDTWLFKYREWIYMRGYTDDPPRIWYRGKEITHPRA